MGVKLSRSKQRIYLLTIIYRIQKLLPFSAKNKLKFFLNLEWIFQRLSHEQSFNYYTAENHPIRLFSKNFILAKITSNDTVLDLGCNQGAMSSYISEKAKEVVGIDYNEKAIALAKTNYQRNNLSFVHGEALAFLNKNEKKFDVLILSHILEHLDDPKDFLIQFKKFFRLIFIEVPDFDRYYLNLYRKDLGLPLIYTDDDHISEFDRDELKSILSSCQLEIIQEEYRYGVQKIWCKTNN